MPSAVATRAAGNATDKEISSAWFSSGTLRISCQWTTVQQWKSVVCRSLSPVLGMMLKL